MDERRSWSIINVLVFIASEKLRVMVPVDKFSAKLSRVTVVLSGATVVVERAILGSMFVILLPYAS